MSVASGWDELAAGRIVSVAATGLVILFAGLIVFRALVCVSGLRAAVVCAVIGAPFIGSFIPVQLFSALMRALAFGFAEVSLGLHIAPA